MFDTRPEQKSSTVRRRSGRRAKHRRSRRLQPESLESRVLLATFVVSSSDDSGRGTLREAITLANANPGKDLIDFNFQELEQIFMPGNVTFNLNWGTVERGLPVQAGLIRPRTPLPEITDPVIIDGSISGFSLLPVPGVEIRGDRLEDSETAGLRIASDDVELRGLILNSFPKTAVELRGSRFSTLAGNYIGAHFPEHGGSENETGIQL